MTIYVTLPFSYDGLAHSAQGPGEARSHFGVLHWGWDFSPDDQTLLAYGPGVVVDRHDTFARGTLPAGTADSDIGNFITVEYAPNTNHSFFVTYGHLQQDSIPDDLVAGATFGMGDILGVSGDTGDYFDSDLGTLVPYSNHVHVHFGDSTVGWSVGEVANGSAVASYVGGYVSLQQSASGPVVFTGYNDDDVFFSSQRGMDAHGGAGDDHFYLGFGSNQIDGGAGTNTVVYTLSRPNYDIYFIERPTFGIGGPTQVLMVEGPEGTDTLSNIQWMTFLDAGGPPYQSIDVTALEGYGDLFIADPSVVDAYSAEMGNVWFSTAETTDSVSTTTSAFGITEVFQSVGSLWDQLTSGWTWSREQGPDGTQAITGRQGDRFIAFAEPIQSLEFDGIGSISLPSLLEPKAADDHTDTSIGAEAIDSGAITSFTSAQGAIESSADVDVFRGQLLGGQEYSFMLWADTTKNSRLDPELTIIAPNGSRWQNDNLTDGTTMSIISFEARQGGTYVFEARGVGNSTGSYWLNITPINIDPTADNLSPSNETLPGFEWNGENGDWHGDSDDNYFPTPGWDGNQGNLNAGNRLRGHDGNDNIEGRGGNDIIWGDDDDDDIEGGDGDDTIRGGRDDDTIDGDDGDDLIFGEHGNDFIDGDISSSNGFGHDTIYAGDGRDDVDGGRGNDYIKGEDDNDTLDGNDGDDEIYGDRGDDDIEGDDDDDLLFGGPGNDTLDGGDDRDRLAGEDGDDSLEGGEDDDALYGGDDDDTLEGGPGDDILHGERGTDTADFLRGREGVLINLFDEIAVSSDLGFDRLYEIENVIGSRGDDVIDADHSRNVIRGDDGDDIIRGHNGNDTIFGDYDDDIVWGDQGNDHVYGGNQDDEVRGGLGQDQLFGGSGDDHLRGEQDNDTIDGGSGIDTVFFWGEHDDFVISLNGAGEVIVTDIRADGLEGRDVLTNVEFIEFFDGKASVGDLLAAAPTAVQDVMQVEGDRPTSLPLLGNDITNSSSAHYTNAEVTGGMGAAVIVGGQLIYDPGDNYLGLLIGETASVTVQYTFATSGFQTATGTAAVTVNGTKAANLPTFASPIDAGTVSETDGVVTLDLLGDAGASDPDGGTPGVANVSVTDGNGAGVVFGLTGATLTIDPSQFATALAAGESATVTVSYDVTDGQGGVTPNTGQLVIEGLDGPFTWYLDGDGDGFGVDDPATNQTAHEAPPGTSDVAGDADDGDARVYPGAPEINDGRDNDQDGATDEDNRAPVADAESFDVGENGARTISVSTLLEGDTDADGDTLTVVGVSNASNGQVFLEDFGDGDASNDEVTFIPTPGFSGPASFDYTVADGFGGEDTATVSINVTEAPNLPPFASPIDAGTVSETDGVVTLDLLGDAGASDPDGGTPGVANVSVTDGNGAGVVFGLTGATLTIDPSQFATALAAGESATVTVSYDVTDGQGGVTPNTGQLVIEGLDGPFTWYLDGDGDGFGVDDPATNQTAHEAPPGTSDVAGDADDGDATVYPGAPEINDGRDNDQDGATDEDNRAPVADAESFDVGENGARTISVSTLLEGDTDADGDTLTVVGVSNASNGQVFLEDFGDGDASNDEVTFIPTPGFSGPASFDYTVADGFGGEDTATVSINVTEAPNLPPFASPIDAGTVSETDGVVTLDLLGDAGASDPDGGTPGVANVSVTDGNGAGVVFGLTGATLTIDPSQFATALAAGESATVTVSYDVTDGQGGVTPNTGQLVIEGLDGPFTWYLDGDGDGFGVDDPATNQTAHEAPPGTSDVAGDADDGDATVYPGAPEINDGRDNDQDGATDEDNRAPVADAESFDVGENGARTISVSTLLEGDTDADGDTLTVVGVSNASNGQVFLEDFGDGDASNDEVTFIPTPGFSGPASFDYTIADGFGGEDTATVSINVTEMADRNLSGDEADNTIVGGDGDDTLSGGPGSDTLEGGGGSDQFDVNPGDETITIADFELGLDLLDLLDFARKAALEAFAAATPGSAVLTFDDGTVVHVEGQGVSPETLQLSDLLVAPGNVEASGAPVIVGSALEDALLTVDLSQIVDLDGFDSAAIDLQWLQDGVNIPLATGSSYRLGQADVGSEITVLASFEDDGGAQEELASAPTLPVANVNDLPEGSISIVGEQGAGAPLSVDLSALTDEDGFDPSFAVVEWRRSDTDELLHTGDSFVPARSEWGSDIYAVVSYTDGGGNLESIESAPLSISGAEEDLTARNLTFGSATWHPGDTVSFTYEIENSGAVSVPVSDSGLYISADDIITTYDILLLSDTGDGPLTPGYVRAEGDPNRLTVDLIALGLAPGTYYVGAIADSGDAIAELDEDNNLSNLAQITVALPPGDRIEGTTVQDNLPGTAGPDLMFGLGENDTLEGSLGNDTIYAGQGADTVVFDAPQSVFTLSLSASQTLITDRRDVGLGTDRLISVEFLDFAGDTGLFGDSAMPLNLFDGPTTLTAEQFSEIIELYIAYFNRAPDALGLYYWATEFSNGFTLPQIAKNFFGQSETQAAYASLLNDQGQLEITDHTKVEAFATEVYRNVLGREPDQDGLNYWIGELQNNRFITPDVFILAIIGGAKNPSAPTMQTGLDQEYLATKADLGAYFAVIKGMSDLDDASAAISLFDGTTGSITTTLAAIDGHYADALDPDTGDFLMPLVGVINDPFGVG